MASALILYLASPMTTTRVGLRLEGGALHGSECEVGHVVCVAWDKMIPRCEFENWNMWDQRLQVKFEDQRCAM